jgi:hypothetical protein
MAQPDGNLRTETIQGRFRLLRWARSENYRLLTPNP